MSGDGYELIDFGNGRKLESLAGRLIDRPSPAADGWPRANPGLWSEVQSRFDRQRKVWHHNPSWPDDLSVDCGPFRMPVRPTPFGHIGLFPEQSSNWHWLANPGHTPDLPWSGLNLFAYTGASTMAMVSAGMGVVHVDAAKPNVQAARIAAQTNDWSNRPIRYLVEDARKFVARELRRKRRYHTIVLDPPAYGHGASGSTWRLERDLWPLLDDCLKLLTPAAFRLLVTGHSREVDQGDVLQYLQQNGLIRGLQGSSALRSQAGRSQLKDRAGRPLDMGFYVRIEKQLSD